MLKEIYEQPKAVRDTLAGKIALGKEITLDNVKSTEELAPLYKKINEIQNDRNNLSVTTRKDTIIKDIQTTISEGALTTAANDIDEAYNSGLINESDVEKLKIRLNEKANQIQDQHEQRKQAKYNWNRTVKQNKEADAKKGDEQYFDGVFGGK